MAKTKTHEAQGNKELNDVGPLENWYKLNDALRECTEDEAKDLLKREQAGKNRSRFVLRIHSRINRTRAERERGELKEMAS